MLLYFPVIKTTLILNQGRVYNWKIQQGEGGQQKTTVDKKRVVLNDLVMLTVSGTERVILSEGEGRDVV